MKKQKKIKAILVAGILEGEIEINEVIPYIYVSIPENSEMYEVPVIRLFKFMLIKQISDNKYLYELDKVEM